MDPAMWSTLPKELIWFIFANLPLPQLLSLRRSAMAGNWDLNLDTFEFRRLCAEKHVNMCAIMVPDDDSGTYRVGVHSVGSTSWQKLRLSAGEPSSIGSSSDGGLVCYSLSYECTTFSVKKDSLVIVVVNPLTGDCRELPGHGVRPTHLRVMQLVMMDRNTKRYQVLLVSEVHASVGEVTFEGVIFDSGTGVWTSTKNSTGLYLIGSAHLRFRKEIQMKVLATRPAAYDCATGELLFFFDDGSPWYSRTCVPYALVKDHLFVLKTNWDRNPLYRLSEHQYAHMQQDGSRWTKLKDHHFGPAHLSSNSFPRLLGCRGFLLVVEDLFKSMDTSVYCKVAWLYNLSTGDWLNLREQGNDHICLAPVMLCEVQWDVVP